MKEGFLALIVCLFFVTSRPTPSLSQEGGQSEQETAWKQRTVEAYKFYLQKQLPEAVKAGEEALKIAEKAFPEGHVNIVSSLNNLSQFYYLLERYNEAEPLNKRAIEICVKALGREALVLAIPLINLGGIYRQQRRCTEAEQAYKRSLAI